MNVLRLERAHLRFRDCPGPLLEIRNATLSWSGFATLYASSGAGKTTLFRLLAGWFATGSRDEAFIEANLDIPADVRFVGLHAGLLPWYSVRHNARLMTPGQEGGAFECILRQCGLSPSVASQFPYELSVGMYKRVELALALLSAPRLLLLDEFFSSIDDDAKERMKVVVERYRGDGMTWVIAHERELRHWIGGPEYTLQVTVTGEVIGIQQCG